MLDKRALRRNVGEVASSNLATPTKISAGYNVTPRRNVGEVGGSPPAGAIAPAIAGRKSARPD